MLRRMRSVLSNNRGEGHAIAILFFLLIASIMLYCAVDVYGYMTQKQKLTIAANELMEIIKSENGYDATNRSQFDYLALSQGLNPAAISVEATPKLVQRGATIELNVSMNYRFIGLKPLGQEITIPIKVHTSGLAHTYLR
ncbi:DUF4320 family protein [Paenibacillus sonchi]|uniref:DUF4320 family protein n=1 Tax=Paenibacillus sonchi TaxID=373687 RepID=UPI001E56759C|nr:DUF4320 family protein [Paenibacillus sonchi]MCE3203480.1 DUF4320 family protein [Paenibacillus sonchi]